MSEQAIYDEGWEAFTLFGCLAGCLFWLVVGSIVFFCLYWLITTVLRWWMKVK